MLCKVLECWTEQNFYRRLCERKSKSHKFQDIFKVNIKHDKKEKKLVAGEWKRIGKHRKKRDFKPGKCARDTWDSLINQLRFNWNKSVGREKEKWGKVQASWSKGERKVGGKLGVEELKFGEGKTVNNEGKTGSKYLEFLNYLN